jgi:hypothetical protein
MGKVHTQRWEGKIAQVEPRLTGTVSQGWDKERI